MCRRFIVIIMDPSKFSPTSFSKHRIMSDLLSDASEQTSVWDHGKFVWCKLDTESGLTKKSVHGVRMHYVWMVSEKGTKVTLISLENASALSVRLTEKVNGKVVPARASGTFLNTLLSKVRASASKILNERTRQAVIVQMSSQARSKSGFVGYVYNHAPIKITNNGTLFTLQNGDKFKIKRVGVDKNKVVFTTSPEHYYYVDDLRLCMLICRSGWRSKLF